MKRRLRVGLLAAAIAAIVAAYWYSDRDQRKADRFLRSEVEAVKRLETRLDSGDPASLADLVQRLRNEKIVGLSISTARRRIPEVPEVGGARAMADWLEEHLDSLEFDAEEHEFRTRADSRGKHGVSTTAPTTGQARGE